MTHPMQASYELADNAVMELVDRLCDRWQLDGETRRRLLFAAAPQSHPPERGESASTIERARQLLTVHAGLRLLFPEDRELRLAWVKRRNRALDGATPLEVMLGADDGIGHVLRLIQRDVGV